MFSDLRQIAKSDLCCRVKTSTRVNVFNPLKPHRVIIQSFNVLFRDTAAKLNGNTGVASRADLRADISENEKGNKKFQNLYLTEKCTEKTKTKSL